jgi:Domain of unknown function (DUF3291)
MSRFELAQLNIAKMNAPLDSPEMAGFVSNLDSINALAERSAGFVWLLQSEAGDATSFRPFGEDMLVPGVPIRIRVFPDLVDFLLRFLDLILRLDIVRECLKQSPPQSWIKMPLTGVDHNPIQQPGKTQPSECPEDIGQC